MAAFKDYLNRSLVADLGDRLHQAWPRFERDPFVARASAGLETLEFKARVQHIAAAIREGLPASWAEVVPILVAASGPRSDGAPGSASDGFHNWPLVEVVGLYGADHVSASLDALYQLTQRFSGEFAIRPLLLRDPDQVWARLGQWVRDPDPHVRRLVSEGSRPRLPWGEAIPPDPDRALPLLGVLIADPVEVVRRSAANHLNDLTRTHPDRVLDAVRACGPDQRATVSHALRSLVKQGHPGALALLGVGGGEVAVVEVAIPARVALGGVLPVQVALRHDADAPANVWVDLVVGFPKAGGGHGERVFRGGRCTLGPGERWVFEKRLALRPVTTRANRLGMHTLALQVNGERLWRGTFELVAADPPSARKHP